MKILLVVYDNNSYIHYFPLGMAYAASKMRSEGHSVEIYSQDIYHYPESHLAQKLKDEHYDVVGVGMCAGYYQYAKLMKIAEVVRGKAELWLGGHLVTPDPDYFKEKTGASYVCEGEYDNEEKVDDIAWPAWDLFPIDYYTLIRLPKADVNDRCFPVLSGRGCPYKCNFCYRMIKGHRPRSPESIAEEIKYLKEKYHINYIAFADDLFMTSFPRTLRLCEAIEPLGIKWICNGRLNIVEPSILKIMKSAGCVFINYGIESMDDNALRLMNKKLTVSQIVTGVESTLKAGISPGLNIIWGNYGDTIDSLKRGVNFLLKYDDHAQLRTIRPVTPYPGSQLYQDAIESGALKGIDDFYKKHVNSDLASIQFTGLSNEEFHKALLSANSTLLKRYYESQLNKALKDTERLYRGDKNFRGYRQT